MNNIEKTTRERLLDKGYDLVLSPHVLAGLALVGIFCAASPFVAKKMELSVTWGAAARPQTIAPMHSQERLRTIVVVPAKCDRSPDGHCAIVLK